MAQRVSIHEAKTHLSRLIKEVEAGREIIITRNGKSVASLGSFAPKKRRTVGDFAKLSHKFSLPDDFDDPLPDAWFETDEFPQKPKRRRNKKA
mgnify:CR=1 FL=1